MVSDKIAVVPRKINATDAAVESAHAVENVTDTGALEYVYLVEGGEHWKIGRWTGTLAALKGRYRAYYLDPVIHVVEVPDAAYVERLLKHLVHATDLHMNKRRRQELVEPGEATRRLFVQVAAGGDEARVLRVS